MFNLDTACKCHGKKGNKEKQIEQRLRHLISSHLMVWRIRASPIFPKKKMN